VYCSYRPPRRQAANHLSRAMQAAVEGIEKSLRSKTAISEGRSKRYPDDVS
jgi:hypothetical protein